MQGLKVAVAVGIGMSALVPAGAVSAQTNPRAVVAAVSPVSAAPAAAVPQAPVSRTQRYCVRGKSAGTRILQTRCRTLDDWLALGFDPLTAPR